MPPKTELILSSFSPASPGILDHELPLVAKRRGPRDDQIVQLYCTSILQIGHVGARWVVHCSIRTMRNATIERYM